MSFSNISNWKLKKSGSNGIWIPYMTLVILVQCSTNRAIKPHIGNMVNGDLLFSCERSQLMWIIWSYLYKNCRCRSKWEMILAIYFSNLSNKLKIYLTFKLVFKCSFQLFFLSSVYAPLLRLSPPPGEHDYYFNLDDSEGVCDLFDIPNLDIASPLPGAMASS